MFVGSLLLFKLFKRDSFNISSLTKWYWLFIGFAVFNHVLFSVDQSLSGMMLLRILVIGVLMWGIYNAVYKYNLEKYLVLGFSAALIMNMLILIKVIPVWFDVYFEERFCGTVGNANVYANMIMVALVVIISYVREFKNYGIIFLAAIPSGFFLIFSTGSRAGILVAIMLLIYLIFQLTRSGMNLLRYQLGKRGMILSRNMTFAFLAIVFFVLFKLDLVRDTIPTTARIFCERFSEFWEFTQGGEGDKSTQFRYDYAKEALGLFLEKPLAGIGIDNFKSLNIGYAHNNYLELLADLGIVGFILYYLGLYTFFRKIQKSKHIMKNLFLFFLLLRLVADLTIVSYYLRTIFVTFVFIEAMLDRNARV